MKTRIALSLAVALLAVSALFFSPARPEKPAHLTDRLWIERLPSSETDLIAHLIMIDEEHIGGVGRSSSWRIAVDLFRYRLHGDTVELFLPQDNKKVRVTARTWKCAGEAPEPFELCLELKARRSVLRLYSREDWHLDDGAVPRALAHLATPPPAPATEADDSLPVEEALPDGLK